MMCPECGEKTRVVDSRLTQRGVRRRRECLDCKLRFTTFESEPKQDLLVTTRTGRVVPFDPADIRASVDLVCVNRSVSADEVDQIIGAVERNARAMSDRTVSSRFLISSTSGLLRGYDDLAYVRYVSLFSCNSVEALSGTLDRLLVAKGVGK